MDAARRAELEALARTMRASIIDMNCHAGSGHPGGSLSCVELLAWIYGAEMDGSPEAFAKLERDRFVLSKGHACLALYAALAVKGFFDTEEFKRLRHLGGMLQGHPDRAKTPGVEFNSGSLGQGFSFACGAALGAKRAGWPSRVYALLGDGECNEGEVWEACMFASKHGLDNLVAIVDYNKLQSDDLCENVTALEPLAAKFEAFGFRVDEIDGHDFDQIALAFNKARNLPGRPTAVIAHTLKGKGVSFMENTPKWHGSLAPQGRERDRARRECGCEPWPE